ncbi:MAG: flagellar brake protein [Acidobacteriota bacterium]
MKNLGFISLGTQVTIEVEGVEERFKSRMIGIDGERFLILKTPVSTAAGLVQTNFSPGKRIIVRYLHHGTVWGFRSAVLETLAGDFGILFAAYPSEVENFDLRSAQRVEARIPVRVLSEQEEAMEGLIVDLSATGARILCSSDQIKDAVPTPSSAVTLVARFDTDDEPTTLKCLVRSAQVDSVWTSLGVQYEEPPPEAVASISAYIDRVISSAGG